jgi:hypothetical protein
MRLTPNQVGTFRHHAELIARLNQRAESRTSSWVNGGFIERYLLKAATDAWCPTGSNTMTFNTLKIVGKNGNDRSGAKLAL